MVNITAKIVTLFHDRKHCIRLLLVAGWLSGLILGIISAGFASARTLSMMRMLSMERMSIVGGLLGLLFPLLITALVLLFVNPIYLVPVAACKGFAYGYISGCICLYYGSAGWLLRRLFCFSASWGNICFLFLWLISIDAKREFNKRRFAYTVAMLTVIFLLDYFSVSSLLMMLFDH